MGGWFYNVYCSDGKYSWCTNSGLLFGWCPLLGMSVNRGSSVVSLTSFTTKKKTGKGAELAVHVY